MKPRTAWTTAGPPKGSWSTPRKGVPDIFVHHEGGGVRGNPPDKAAVLRQIEGYVVNNGYIAIDYNVMVFNDGDVWAGREVFHEDAATINNNPTSVSICAVGNYEREPAPDSLIAGIQLAIREIVASGYSNGDPRIRPHREVFGTACPGANLNARMDDIRRGWRSGSIPTPAPIPANLEDEMMFRFAGNRHAVIVDSRGDLQHFSELHADKGDWVGEVIYRECDPKRGAEVSVLTDGTSKLSISAPLAGDRGLLIATAGAGWKIDILANQP